MSKLLLVLVAIGVLGGGGAALYQSSRTEVVPSQPEETATTTASTITVTTLAKEVFISQKSSLDVLKVEKSATTSTGSTVRTSATGRALLETSQKKIVLDHDTQITIPAENNAQVSSIVLLGGSIWSRVEKIFEKGEYYEIQTQNTVAAVRGTSFNVKYVNGVTTVLVDTSAVAVTPIDPATGARLEEKTVIIPEGKKAVVDAKGSAVVSDITVADKANEWYQFNAKLDGSADTVVDTIKPTPPPVPVVKPPAPVPPPPPAAVTPPPPPAEPPLPAGTIILTSVSPTSISAASTASLTLRGRGLLHAVVLSLGITTTNPVVVSGFKIVDDTTITFTLPRALTPGVYQIGVVSDMETGANLDKALTIF